MEKFKAIVSKIDIPDHIAVESLMNTLHVDSTFRQDFYRYPTKSVSDAIARSHNFIRMEEDTREKFAKEAAVRQRSSRTNDTRPEPRQHSSGGNTTQKRGYISSVDDEESPKSAAITREKGTTPTEPASSNSEEPKKWCLYHKRDSHDTKECKVLIGQFFDGITNGTIQMPTSPTTPKNTKSWSKNKEKKAQKSQKNTAPSEERASPERTPINNVGPANDSSEDEHPRRRRRVEVILSRPCNSSDDDVPTVQPDLHDKLNSKDK
uniref:Retrotransposon gag domain-containing protein n=1 Tax=Brassica oleracea var. oleracea TaxID=109376 RepID=A0A0D3ECU8_BRAOL